MKLSDVNLGTCPRDSLAAVEDVKNHECEKKSEDLKVKVNTNFNLDF